MGMVQSDKYKAGEVIRLRRSCRTYRPEPLAGRELEDLRAYISRVERVPFGSAVRFALVNAGCDDNAALKEVGSYGIIRNAPAYIAGAVKEGDKCLEDYGYAMESIILHATSLGLGTCWLGGTFTKSSFSARISVLEGEILPAVTAVGYPADKRRVMESLIRMGSGADHRKPRELLFFSGDFSTPLSGEDAGAFGEALELVRLGPSASNRQPWRVVVRDGAFHFYLQRTKGYYERYKSLIGMADLQRVDMGIAMCHFERAARDARLAGEWVIADPGLQRLPELTEYVVSWKT